MDPSFGTRLRLQRERQQVGLDDIAERTKIKRSLLEGLERDDLAYWPGGIYRRSYVRAYAQAIGLTPAQRRTILDELRATQTALAPLQANMMEPALDLIELLGQTRVDEAKVVAKMDQVLEIENEVKKKQAALLVRIKNTLSPEQQARLRELRNAEGTGRKPDNGSSQLQ